MALADSGSFGRAAQQVHLSQPALSRSIDSLEDALGARLMDRVYGGVQLTAAGELVLSRARDLLASAQQIQREVRQLQGLEVGQLNVGLGPFPAAILGEPVLTQLIREFPQWIVNIEVADPGSLCQRLQSQHLDLIIADTRSLKNQSGLQIKRLPHAGVAFFVRAKHPLLKATELQLDDLMDYPVGCPELMPNVLDYFSNYVTRSDRPLFSVRCNDMRTLRQLALRANAVILAPYAGGLNHATESLLPLTLKRPAALQTHYGLVSLRKRTPSAAARKFSALVHSVLAQM